MHLHPVVATPRSPSGDSAVGSWRVAEWILIAAVWTAVAAPAAYGRVPFRPRLIADHGFGDERNSYAWSMAWFKGRLYVGTARSEFCVEAATVDFYDLGDYRSALASI